MSQPSEKGWRAQLTIIFESAEFDESTFHEGMESLIHEYV